MKKTAVMLVIGLISGGIGIYLLYVFFASIKTGTNFIFLVLSLTFFAASIALLIKITNPKNHDTTVSDQTEVYEKTLETLEKNQATLAEWEKTNDQKDRLELLKMEGEAQEDAEKKMG